MSYNPPWTADIIWQGSIRPLIEGPDVPVAPDAPTEGNPGPWSGWTFFREGSNIPANAEFVQYRIQEGPDVPGDPAIPPGDPVEGPFDIETRTRSEGPDVPGPLTNPVEGPHVDYMEPPFPTGRTEGPNVPGPPVTVPSPSRPELYTDGTPTGDQIPGPDSYRQGQRGQPEGRVEGQPVSVPPTEGTPVPGPWEEGPDYTISNDGRECRYADTINRMPIGQGNHFSYVGPSRDPCPSTAYGVEGQSVSGWSPYAGPTGIWPLHSFTPRGGVRNREGFPVRRTGPGQPTGQIEGPFVIYTEPGQSAGFREGSPVPGRLIPGTPPTTEPGDPVEGPPALYQDPDRTIPAGKTEGPDAPGPREPPREGNPGPWSPWTFSEEGDTAPPNTPFVQYRVQEGPNVPGNPGTPAGSPREGPPDIQRRTRAEGPDIPGDPNSPREGNPVIHPDWY